jgi:hypothetical protein
MIRNKARKTARRYKTDKEILGRLDTELQAVVDAVHAKIEMLFKAKGVRA